MRTSTTIATLVALGALVAGCAHHDSTMPPSSASNTTVDMSRSSQPMAGTGYDQTGYGANGAASTASTTGTAGASGTSGTYGQTGATQAMPQSGSTGSMGSMGSSGSTGSTGSTYPSSTYPSASSNYGSSSTTGSNNPSSNTTGSTQTQAGSATAPSTMGSSSSSSAASGSAGSTSGTAFPTTQGNGPTDTKITAAVRSAIAKDKALSAFARNVTVITNGGRVVLTGTVKNDHERTLIETKARAVDGVTDVDNRLELAGNPDKSDTSRSTKP